MKVNRFLLLAVLVSVAPVYAHADGVPGDARIIVGQDGPKPTPVGKSFLVPVDSVGGSDLNDDFENGGTQNIIELIFTAKLSKKDTIACVPDNFYFGNCTVTPGKGNKVTIIFDDPLSGGIPPGADFFVGLNNAGQSMGDWKKDGVKDLDSQAVFAVSTPEPSGVLLLLTGLGSLWLRHKKLASTNLDS